MARRVDLPEYPSEQVLREKLLQARGANGRGVRCEAVSEGHEGFGFA